MADTPEQETQFWCNFCGFRSESKDAYLAHSCQEVLAARNVPPAPPTERNCQ